MIKLRQHGFGGVEIMLIFLIVGLIGGLGYYVYQKRNTTSSSSQYSASPTDSKSDKKTEEPTTPDGFVEYVNEELGFKFAYPKAWGIVDLRLGILGDVTLEKGKGYKGSFSENGNASFGLQTSDWEYTGAGRGGPIYATGFNKYKIIDPSNDLSGTPSIIKNSDDTNQIYAFSTDFNIIGAVLVAEHKFNNNKIGLAGIEFYINFISENNFDATQDMPESLISNDMFEQMQSVLDTVKEL